VNELLGGLRYLAGQFTFGKIGSETRAKMERVDEM